MASGTSVGARLLKGTAKKLTESFWDKFAESVPSRLPR